MQLSILHNLKNRIKTIIQTFKINLTHKKNPQGRHLKIENDDALALALYQHASTRATKKSVYEGRRWVLSPQKRPMVITSKPAIVQVFGTRVSTPSAAVEPVEARVV